MTAFPSLVLWRPLRYHKTINSKAAIYSGVMHPSSMNKIPIILCLAVVLISCQSSHWGKCEESDSSVSPACLYEGGYPSCQLSDKEYELARKNAWGYEEGGFTEEYFANTGKSQDLGSVCRFYFYVKPEHSPMEPYQWLVYVNKNTLLATHMVPVIY